MLCFIVTLQNLQLLKFIRKGGDLFCSSPRILGGIGTLRNVQKIEIDL